MKSILENKKAEIGENLIYFIVIAFVMLIVMACIIWLFSETTTELVKLPKTAEGDVNMSEAAQDTFGQVNAALIPSAKIMSFVIIFGMVLSMLFVEFLSRKNPAYFFIDLLILIFAVILSVYISNQYEALLSGLDISSTLSQFKSSTSVMRNLPRWVTVIGLTGMALSFIGIIKRRGEGDFR